MAEREPLARLRTVAHLLDQLFRVPGTNLRFGLDPIIGLVPGLGDLVGAALGLYGVLLARQLGAPPSVRTRMLLNLAVDGIVGAVPLLGDLFDFGFKAHLRNRLLLERWLENPRATRRGSVVTLWLTAIGVMAVLAGVAWLVIAALRALFGALGG